MALEGKGKQDVFCSGRKEALLPIGQMLLHSSPSILSKEYQMQVAVAQLQKDCWKRGSQAWSLERCFGKSERQIFKSCIGDESLEAGLSTSWTSALTTQIIRGNNPRRPCPSSSNLTQEFQDLHSGIKYRVAYLCSQNTAYCIRLVSH